MANNWMVRGGIYSDNFQKLLNPSWLELIKKLESPTNLQSFAQHETGVMKFARELEKANQLSSLAFNNSETMRSIERLTNQDNLMRSILRQPESMRKFQGIVNSTPLSSIVRQQKGAENLLAKLNQLSSFKALTQLQNSPFSGDLSLAITLNIDTPQSIDESLLEIDSQISEEVSAASDFNDLSEKTKKILLYLFSHCFLPFLVSCYAAYVMQNADDAKVELQSVSTAAEVRSFSRSANTKFDRSLLAGFRITTAHSLHFREGPSMKSNVITGLPIGTLVDVIDKANRSWLLVEVEVNGSIEQGWISRRHTVFFK
tara:strand:+ start:14506 stop:15450 length:945 start_codon:yes stop_codon:yes gene_type:complete